MHVRLTSLSDTGAVAKITGKEGLRFDGLAMVFEKVCASGQHAKCDADHRGLLGRRHLHGDQGKAHKEGDRSRHPLPGP
jgi:hypothetical protein